MSRTTCKSPIENETWNTWKQECIDAAQANAYRVIGTLTELREDARGTWKGCSPYRKERTPSFYVYPDGLCHDYGTGETKDVVGCVQLARSVDFREGLNYVAACLGIDTWDERKAKSGAAHLDEAQLEELRRWQGEERRVQELMTMIAEVCHRMLPSSVRAFLLAVYGIADETILLERIGWVPAGLFEIMCERAPWVDEDDWLATGFFHRTKDGVITTNGAHRILFPYWRGSLCVYSIGRLHEKLGAELKDWELAKYKKHPTHDAIKRPYISTTILNNRLWGEDVFSKPIDTLVWTEGVTDAIMLRQHGFNVVSPVTTRARDEDYPRVITLALRFVRNKRVVFVNDNDELDDGTKPGLAGSIRSARAFWLAGLRAQVGQLPKGEGVRKIDCAEFLRDGGNMQAVIDAALDYPHLLLSLIPKDVKAADLPRHLPALAEAMVPMDRLSRVDFQAAIASHFIRGLRGTIRSELKPLLEAATAAAKTSGGIVEGMSARTDGAAAADGAPKAGGRHEGLRGAVTLDPKGFYTRGGAVAGGAEQVSTFALTPLRRSIRDDGMMELVVRVESPDESALAVAGDRETVVSEWLVPHKAWGSKREFIRSLPTSRVQFTGGDDEVQGILARLTDTALLDGLPLVRSTPIIGRHDSREGSPRFVLPAGTLDKDGWMAQPDVLYRANGNPLDHQLPREQSVVAQSAVAPLAAEALPMLLNLFSREVTQPIVAWMFMAPFAPLIRARLGGVPFLNPWGEQGSGKSSLVINGLARIFYSKPESISVKATPFAIAKVMSHTNALPILFDEYKLADMGRAAEPFRRRVRASYSGETEIRGQQDMTVNDYALTAPMVIAGEQRVEDDPALIERGIFATFEKRYLSEHPEAKALFAKWKELPVHRLGPAYLCWTLSCDFDALLREATALVATALAQLELTSVPARIEANLIANVFGLLAFDAWAASLGIDIGEIDATAHVESLLRGILGGDIKTGVTPMNALDYFVRDAAALIEQGLAVDGVHWTRTGGLGSKLVAFRVELIEQLRREGGRKRGDVDNSPGANPIFRIARDHTIKEGGYVVSTAERVYLKPEGRPRSRQRCLVIDPTLLPPSLGIDEESFPRESDREDATMTQKQLMDTWRKPAP